MKKITLISLILIFSTISFAHDDNVPHYVKMENSTDLVNPDVLYEYMILKGDYLWMLAGKFYNDPYKWTDIYSSNPYIIDPNWIYPNNWLVIPNVFADENGNPMYSGIGGSTQIAGEAIDLDSDGIFDGVDLDGDGVIDTEAGIDLDGDGVIDGYDLNGDGEIDVKSSTALARAHGADSDGDGVIDTEAGIDLDGDGVIDTEAGIDLDGDGVIDGYDLNGDGEIDVKSSTALAGATAAATAITVDNAIENEDKDAEKSCVKSYCGKPGWKLGLHAGYPVGGGPEDENLNLGLLLGTPLGVKVGPLSFGLGAGAFTYDFENLYFGAGILASLCINDLLKLDIPMKLQLHGTGFYIFGEYQGLGLGAIGSASIPLGKSPLSLGIYGALGKYYPNDNDFNWSNIGGILFYNF